MDWKTNSNMDVYTNAERDRAQRGYIALNSAPFSLLIYSRKSSPDYNRITPTGACKNGVNYRELRKSDSVMLFEKQGKNWVSVRSFNGTMVLGETSHHYSW